MRIKAERLRLYAVTEAVVPGDEERFFSRIADAIDGGAEVVQLREKTLDDEAFTRLAERFVALCREKGAVSIINDRVDIAAKVDADGVHVGQEDLSMGRAREILGPDKIIGVSAHDVEEALAAEAAGADYLGSGAVFPSGTKPDARGASPAVAGAVARAVSIPVVAIGGITRENILQLKGYGLAGAAVVSALFAQKDVRTAAEELRRLAEEISL